MQALEMKHLIPSLEDIKALYEEISGKMRELSTVADVIKFEEEYNITMEIDGIPVHAFKGEKPEEWIRCENWGDLDYIYLYNDGKIRFDVWCDLIEDDFIDYCSIENIDFVYPEMIRRLCKVEDGREFDNGEINSMKNLISIFKMHGTSYEDMISKYEINKDYITMFKNKEKLEGLMEVD